MPVALLNYLDRQMLASMKYSVMRDHPEHRHRGELGLHARAVQVGLRLPQPHRRLRRRPLQPAAHDLRQPVRLVGRDVVDRARQRPTTSCSGALAHGHQRGVLHPGGAGADRGLPHRPHALARRRPAPDGDLLRRDRRRLRRLRRRRPDSGLAVRLRRLRRLRHALRGAAGAPAARRAQLGRLPRLRRRASPGAAVRELLTNVSFILLVLYFTLPALAGWVVRDWMPAILKQQFDIGQGQAGVAATLYWQAAAIVGAVVGGWLADRWMRRNARGRIFVSAIGMSLIAPGDLRRRQRRLRSAPPWRS